MDSQTSPDSARAERFERLATEVFDLVVVGGGITGAGIARDAAQRGLRVCIIDKGDWASGTSSKSSKLIHGGLRYLENMQLGLVMEGTRERYRQRRLNPNLVWPIAFVMPVFRKDKHSLFKINLGLWLYDLLSLFRNYRKHRRHKREATLARVRGLRAQGLKGSVHYYDCRTDDARLTLANVIAAERHGAIALNYCRYIRPTLDQGGRVASVSVTDEQGRGEVRVRCRHVIYAAGPWTDGIPSAPGDGRLLRPTKGVHIVVSAERLPITCAVAMTSVSDGRACFAIPFDNVVYLGTTDTDYSGELDTIDVSADDVRYILKTANHYFPSAQLAPDDVRSSWGGLRPLIRSDAESAYRTSREHEIFDVGSGITAIAGGKLTTYREMAQQAVDAVLADLKSAGSEPRVTRCRTHKTPLDPSLPKVADVLTGPPDEFERLLWRTHGSAASVVRRRMQSHPAERARVCPDLGYVMAQVSHAVFAEHARTVEDVLARRLQILYRAADRGAGAALPVATHMASLLGRDAAWIERQVADYRRLAERSIAGAGAAKAEAVEGALAQTG